MLQAHASSTDSEVGSGLDSTDELDRQAALVSAKVQAALTRAFRYAAQMRNLRSRHNCYWAVRQLLERSNLAEDNTLTQASARLAEPDLRANGFIKLPTMDPRQAPMGAVIVYDSKATTVRRGRRRRVLKGHGHIEVKVPAKSYQTLPGFKNATEAYVSDFVSAQPISEYRTDRPVLGIYYPTKVFK